MKKKKIRVVRIRITHPYLGIPRTLRFEVTEFDPENIKKIEALALNEVALDTGYEKENFNIEVLQETD
ncbi:hypothetical protein A3I42_02060 [Candidatus Uhrbacteria bacterium RIFCSPLOWO2_02_FULL_49_11]|uniref:Uncharacterized protein n=1 Tax=Candidatus Uhrbacteria bacterium RIFCSPLOWO2_02_FULL_49_11 TaxID=1802409 RepID=A0A1F7VB86_9BACT|nr:MAG: hypothetical protein A3I42_02060 [Candidatus Uhrbacteria bacterium RIFCSPLOWO2_02_FULL_49_11]